MRNKKIYQLFSRKMLNSVIALIIIVLLFFIVFIFLGNYFPINANIITESIQSFGFWAPIIFILIMALAIVISPIPSLPLTISSGLIWGTFLGTVYSIIGAMIGASISFFIARAFGRKIVHRILGDYAIFCDKCTRKSLFFIILISRMFPFFQFDVVSYGAGLTAISFQKFVIASTLGMIPTTYLFVRFGSAVTVESWISVTFSFILIISIFIVPKLFKKRLKKFIGGDS